MRRHIAPTAVLLSLLVSGCGDDEPDTRDPDGDRSSSAPLSACGDLTDDDVLGLTGVTVTHQERTIPGGATCTFSGDDGPVVTVLSTSSEADVDDLVEGSRIGNEEESSTSDVDVPGTEAAVLVTDTSYDITTTSLVATTGAVGYTVYGYGPSPEEEGRVAVAALTLVLGGEVDIDPVARTLHPCDVLTADELGGLLGGRVTASSETLGGSGAGLCSYDATETPDGVQVEVTMFELDRGAPLATVVRSRTGLGAEEEDLEVPGATAAYLLSDPRSPGSVEMFLAGPVGTFGLTVEVADDTDAAVEAARSIAPLALS